MTGRALSKSTFGVIFAQDVWDKSAAVSNYYQSWLTPATPLTPNSPLREGTTQRKTQHTDVQSE